VRSRRDRDGPCERGRVAACEFDGGDRRTSDQLLEGVGHAVIAIVAMQLAHGDEVCDQMRRQVSLVELGFPNVCWHVDVLDGAAQERLLNSCAYSAIAMEWAPVSSYTLPMCDSGLARTAAAAIPTSAPAINAVLPSANGQADDVIVSDAPGSLHQEHAIEESGWTEVHHAEVLRCSSGCTQRDNALEEPVRRSLSRQDATTRLRLDREQTAPPGTRYGPCKARDGSRTDKVQRVSRAFLQASLGTKSPSQNAACPATTQKNGTIGDLNDGGNSRITQSLETTDSGNGRIARRNWYFGQNTEEIRGLKLAPRALRLGHDRTLAQDSSACL